MAVFPTGSRKKIEIALFYSATPNFDKQRGCLYWNIWWNLRLWSHEHSSTSDKGATVSGYSKEILLTKCYHLDRSVNIS